MKAGQVINRRSGEIVARQVWRADSFWTRLRGLLGHPPLARGEGLWLVPCQQVHMIGMRYSISVWFLDRGGRICYIIDDLRPNKISSRNRKAATVLEFPAGWAATTGARIGDLLEWVNNDP